MDPPNTKKARKANNIKDWLVAPTATPVTATTPIAAPIATTMAAAPTAPPIAPPMLAPVTATPMTSDTAPVIVDAASSTISSKLRSIADRLDTDSTLDPFSPETTHVVKLLFKHSSSAEPKGLFGTSPQIETNMAPDGVTAFFGIHIPIDDKDAMRDWCVTVIQKIVDGDMSTDLLEEVWGENFSTVIKSIRDGSRSVIDCIRMKPTYESLTLSKVGTTRERRCFFGGGGVCENTYHHNTKAMLCMECTQDTQIEGSKRYYYNLLTGGKEYFVKRGNTQTPRPGRIPGELLFEPNVLSGVVSTVNEVALTSKKTRL